MYFKNLPKNIQDGIVALTTDDEFQKRFATDPILDQLDEQKLNKTEQLKLLQIHTTGKVTIAGETVNAITPIMWSYLWILQNPFVTDTKKGMNETDIDTFMYVLANGVDVGNPVQLVTNSFGYCAKNVISYDTAVEIILTSIKLAFKPLCLFPKIHGNKNSLLYDVDWLTSLIAQVHAVTNYTPQYIMNQLPMTSVCFYFAQYARINGNDAIYKRSPEELLIAQDNRCCQLIVDRLIQNKIISLKDRQKILAHITTKPQ